MPASRSPTRWAGVSFRYRKAHFEIGRRETNDLRLAGSEVSRDHAEIDTEDNQFLIRDKSSRYGTYVNGEQVTERALVHGDRIRLGRSGGAEMVFLLADSAPAVDKATTTAIGDLRQIAALLEGLRALGSGRVLDDVLALVLDSAIEVSGAERGFIMLGRRRPASSSSRWRARGAATRFPAAASPPAARFPKRSSARASRASSPICSTAIWRTCTWAPSRSASATCSACR